MLSVLYGTALPTDRIGTFFFFFCVAYRPVRSLPLIADDFERARCQFDGLPTRHRALLVGLPPSAVTIRQCRLNAGILDCSEAKKYQRPAPAPSAAFCDDIERRGSARNSRCATPLNTPDAPASGGLDRAPRESPCIYRSARVINDASRAIGARLALGLTQFSTA